MSTGKSVGVLLGAVSGLVGIGGGILVGRYRHDMRAARDRLASVDRQLITTPWGHIEYAERGSGEPLLISHGIYQSCESALMFRDLFPDCRVIAPSRFGYMASSMPTDATPADQADAFLTLLDALGLAEVDVVGLSAGTTSALQLALRHPERVKRLVVLSGNLPGSSTAFVQPSWARPLNRQFPLWALKVFAPSTMAFLAGVPKQLSMTSEEARFVTEFIDSLFPVSPAGVAFDAVISNADVNGYKLEAITMPTLLVHAKDDPLVTYDAAEKAARRIPRVRLLSLESGGHLMLGQTPTVRNELASFLARPVGLTSL